MTDGMTPTSLLSKRKSTSRYGSWHRVEKGISPVRLLSRRMMIKEEQLQISGISPMRLLGEREMSVMLFRRPSVSGITPVRRLLWRLRNHSYDSLPSFEGMLTESWLSLRSKYSSADRLLIAGEMTPVRLKPARSREITRPLELHATPVQVHIWEAQSERFPWTLDLKESRALRSTTVGFIAKRWLEAWSWLRQRRWLRGRGIWALWRWRMQRGGTNKYYSKYY